MSYLLYILALSLVIACTVIFFQYRQLSRLKSKMTPVSGASRPGEENKQTETSGSRNEKEDFKTKLISVLAHDFRGAFMNIISLMDFYKKGQVPPERFDALFTELKGTSQSNLEAFENTLKWVKTQLKGYTYKPLEVKVSDVMNQTIKNNISEIKRKKISLSVKGDEEDLIVYADPQLLGFVMNNLLNNAIKYSYPGSQVECMIDREKQEEMIKVQVIDYGVGMDTRTKDAIFCHDKTIYTGTEGEKGAGIGLLICKDFIEIQQGKLDVASEAGKGSAFTLRIPGKAGNVGVLCNNQSDSFCC